MAKSIFYIDFLLKNEKKSISELSNQLINIFKELSVIDNVFSSFKYMNKDFEKKISIESLDIKQAKNELAKVILESNKSDIKRYEKVEKPTLEYSRDFGFSHTIQFYLNKRKCFSITGNIATNNYPYFRLDSFDKDSQFTFEWYEKVTRCIVKTLNPINASIIIRLDSFFDKYVDLKVKCCFGWLTYFSNDNEIQIPDDLEGVDYERTEKGKYIILTREDFTVNKEAYEVQRDKLLAIMKEVKERVPEYSL